MGVSAKVRLFAGHEASTRLAHPPAERFTLVPAGLSARDAHILEIVTAIDDVELLKLQISISRCTLRLVTAEPELAGMVRVMDAGASLRVDRVQLSDGYNVVDLPEWRGQGIGTLAMNRMIAWAQRWHPQAEVWPLKLQRYGAPILPTDRRIGFYRRFGFRWDTAEQEAEVGSWPSAALRVEELQRAPQPANIRRLTDG
jgi:GNAT superfamily N-acetyltransferase